jgi:hypothetical protein
MLKKIPDAEWAKIATQAMKGKGVLLPDVCAGNFRLHKSPIPAQKK